MGCKLQRTHSWSPHEGFRQLWRVAVQAGLQRAVQPGTKDAFKLRRVPVVQEPLLVTGSDGSYISFVPGST